jgi:hypothetical protein
MKSAQYPVLLVVEIADSSLSVPPLPSAAPLPTLAGSVTVTAATCAETESNRSDDIIPSLFNEEGRRINVSPVIPSTKQKTFLFKMEDDLRQDSIVLQIFKYLDEAFKKAGLDLNLVFYDVLPTGPREGNKIFAS